MVNQIVSKGDKMKKLILLSILLIVGCDENIVAPDTTAPTVTITYPANGSTLTTTDTIRVDVSSESEISSVKFLIDGIEVYADSLPPYEYVWDVCVQGTDNHTVFVKAEDSTGNQGQSNVNTYVINASYDCESVCGGDSGLDNCGECDADTTNDNTTCEQDCAGIWGGDAEFDDCGVCDGIDGYVAGTCYDCADTPNGDAVVDNCGVCDNDGTNDCEKDCADEWGGDAEYSECVVGIYTLTTYLTFETSDCSGDGDNQLDGTWEAQLILNSDGSGMQNVTIDGDSFTISLLWTQNGNQVTLYFDSDEDEYIVTYTLGFNSLEGEHRDEDSCASYIWTKD